MEDHADHVLGTFKTQKEAIDCPKKNSHAPLIARGRRLMTRKSRITGVAPEAVRRL